MDKINIEDILSKHGVVWETKIEGEESQLSADLSDVKAAIKEIVELVIDKCAKEAKIKDSKDRVRADLPTGSSFKTTEVLVPVMIIDKDSILNVKKMIDYE